MKFLYNLSIKSKITAIITGVSLFAIILGFSIITINNIGNFKKDLVSQNSLTAKLLSEYLLYALIFDDSQSAINQLDKLGVLKFINNAEVYNAKGEFFASYNNNSPSHKKLLKKTFSHQFVNNELHIIEPVWNDKEFLGTILLRVSINSLAVKVRGYIIVLIITGLIVGVFIILLANSFQKIISKPILNLAKSIEEISKSNNYSIRVNKMYNDEIGALYDGFNNMLEQIVKRDIETYRVQSDLKESQEQFSAFMDVLPAAAFIKNPDSSYRFVNQFLENNFDAKDWVSDNNMEHDFFSHPHDKEEELERDKLALTGTVVSIRLRFFPAALCGQAWERPPLWPSALRL